ncbi:GSCFA domain-containing protein [Alphaproteobacteria bacterium]|nr:GSCFA domain-containing protein [Alphaproteobacteria bacterium]
MNPYSNLKQRNFWKPTIEEFRNSNFINELWFPIFFIGKKTPVLTLGSCFGQHVGNWLNRNNYNWLSFNNEVDFPVNQNKANITTFSFNTGNIYTARGLRQWLEQAFEDVPMNESFLIKNNRFFDPQRQKCVANGFGSLSEMLNSKRTLLRNIKKGFEEAELLIFTLGLTEAWCDNSGLVFSSAPGIIAGEFNPELYYHANFSHSDICKDLNWVNKRLLKINPKIKILLTVSPVPLTATHNNNNVLVQSSASKSILRSTCSELTNENKNFDYFPSYELMTTHINTKTMFEDNLRTIKEESINYVMKHFEHSIKILENQQCRISRRENQISHIKIENLDSECEESLLQKMAPNLSNQSKIFLIGDSHLHRLSNSLNKLEINHHGGGVMAGSSWTEQKFRLNEEKLFVPLESSAAKYWEEIFQIMSNTVGPKLIITNIGSQTHRCVSDFKRFSDASKNSLVNGKTFVEYLQKHCFLQIQLIKKFVDLSNTKVIFVTDPPTQLFDASFSKQIEYFRIYDKNLDKFFKFLGCDVFNARKFFGDVGLPKKYFSGKIFLDGGIDWFHGGEAYYYDLAEALFSRELTQQFA